MVKRTSRTVFVRDVFLFCEPVNFLRDGTIGLIDAAAITAIAFQNGICIMYDFYHAAAVQNPAVAGNKSLSFHEISPR